MVRRRALGEKYNPTKVATVPRTLDLYAGREEELFEALVTSLDPGSGQGYPGT